VQHAVTLVVWRLTLAETERLEALFSLDPLNRLKVLMSIMTGAAKRDSEVLRLLSKPGVVNELRKMAVARQVDQASEVAPSGQEDALMPH
jgi:aromatic ring hydroxylase